MAKYLITYKCGHEVERQLFGKISDRENYISWAQEQLCPACQRKIHHDEVACQRKAYHDEALADAAAKGYPKLEGSEKQVAWAMDLRYTFVNDTEDYIKEKIEYVIPDTYKNEAARNEQLARFDKFCTELREVVAYLIANKTSAKYWIDSRFWIDPLTYKFGEEKTPKDLVREIKKEMEQKKLG